MRVLYGIILSVQMSSLLAQVFQLEPSTATWDDANAACAADQFTLIPGRRYRAKKLQNLLTDGQTIWLQGWRGVTDFEKSADGKVKSLKVDISRNVKKGIPFVCESGPGTFFIPEGTAKSLKGASKLCVEQQGTLAKFSTEDYITKAFDLMEQDMPYWVGNVTTKETIAKLCLAARLEGKKFSYIYDTCSKQHNYACLKDKAAIDAFHYVVSFKMSIYKDFQVEIEEKKALTTSSTIPTTSSTVSTSSSTISPSSSTMPTTSSAVTNMTSMSSALPLTSPGLPVTPSHLPTMSSTLPTISLAPMTSVTTSSVPNTTSLTKSTDQTTTHPTSKTISSFLTSTTEPSTPELLLPTVFTRQNTSVTEGVKDAVTMDNITNPYTQKSTVQIQSKSTNAEVASPTITTVTSIEDITGESTTNSVVSSMKSIEATSVSTNVTTLVVVKDTTESRSMSSSQNVTDYFEQTTLAFDLDDTQTNEAVSATIANHDEAGKTETVKPLENATMVLFPDNKTEYNVAEKMKSVHEGTTDISQLFEISINSTTDLPSKVETKASTDKTVPDLLTSSSTTSTTHDKNTIYNVADNPIDFSDLDVDKGLITTDLNYTVETSSTYVTETTERTSSIAPFKPHTSTTSMESERVENISTYTVLREVSSDTSTTVMVIDLDEPDTPNGDDTVAPTDADVSVPGGEKVLTDYEEGNTAESTRKGEREAPNDNWELPLIIAFIIMAVAVLIAILLALYLYRRRKMQQRQEITKESDVELRAKTAVNGDKKERETATFKDSAYDV